ncbi:MAG: glycosyltransferase [Blastocatellales bacterium]
MTNQPNALAVAMDTVMNNAVLRQRLCDGALTLAHEWFSWEKTTRHFLEAVGAVGL